MNSGTIGVPGLKTAVDPTTPVPNKFLIYKRIPRGLIETNIKDLR